MRRSRDIRARAEASAIGEKSRRRERSQEDEHNLTFDANEFGVHEPNSTRSDSPFLRNAPTDGHTDRQTDTSPLYIDLARARRIHSG